mmetsp:Transcript_17268/g.26723  ORF Transcript_17268/g.26723 Transcript_17268/m.26723 type:complete len:292 (-) Transcript_17268:310-1185(-)|eukprot:CAMPEP_0195295196 /NCGR_PEP_ID=MMETSP0707-20130614/16823_1 /TAXON_ID=33640 /ORGANISM="Asterionellopsis glacialis, Strain CCMP134" /LENGTH=291 /DNA_ID=CAMNT_0040356359 /DNA_START=129 /DNA_END=1004 /DNA_ORIENTATION=-
MSPSSSSVLLMAGSAALLVGAAATMFGKSTSSSTSSSNPKDITDIVELDESDCISADDVCQIFDKLFLEMQQVLAQLSQQVQQIQMSGQQIPEAQLRQLLKAEFQRALEAKQKLVFEEYNVDEDCLEEATWEFMSQEDEYPKVKRTVERFQKLYENVSGESVVGKRPGGGDGATTTTDMNDELLSEEKVVEAAELYFGTLTKCMSTIVHEFNAQGKDIHDRAVAQELHMKFASQANDTGEEALKEKYGISLKTFQASIESHAQKPNVARALAMLQMKQQQDLMAMGVPAMG